MDNIKPNFLKWRLYIKSNFPHRYRSQIKMILKSLVYLPIILPTIILLVCLLRTLIVLKPKEEALCQQDEWDYINRTEVLKRFMSSINFATVSLTPDEIDTSEILKFHDYLIRSFPLIHNSSFVTKKVINNFSLLYHVQGINTTIKPYILTAHLDVVPANIDTWTVDPFNSTIQNGYVYGRGTIDDKHNVMGMMEALEALLKMGYQPKRSIYIAFGHDEEVGGVNGAAKITEHLQGLNVTVEFVLDEGLVVLDRMLPGLKRPLALIGITEKGYLTLKLKVDGLSGHSSMPPHDTAIGILSRALHRLESKQQPIMFGKGPETEMFDIVAPYACFGYSFVYANVWLLSPIMAWIMSHSPSQNALIRTTTALTMIHGGVKENVIPSYAYALVNHRIHPSQTVKEVITHDIDVINDKRVNVEVIRAQEAHPISNHDQNSIGYESIKLSIREIFQNAVVAPGVLTGNTDSCWYKQLSHNIYRFSPSFLTSNDLTRFHGDDERILVENYFQVVNFYIHLIKNVDNFKFPVSGNVEL